MGNTSSSVKDAAQGMADATVATTKDLTSRGMEALPKSAELGAMKDAALGMAAAAVATTKDVTVGTSLAVVQQFPPLRATKPLALTKELVFKKDEMAAFSIEAAFAADKSFLELVAVEASAGRRRVAAQLIEGFKLAMPSPTEAEIKVSLSATLGVLAAEAQRAASKAAAAPASSAPSGESTAVTRAIDLSRKVSAKSLDLAAGAAKRLPLIAPKPFSKPLILKADDAAAASIVAVFGEEAKFGTMVRAELETLYATRAAARRVADGFKLALPSPTPEEVLFSAQATAADLARQGKLPPPPKLTKALLKKPTPAAVSAVMAMFAKSAPFDELAHAALADDVAAYSEAHLAFALEDARAKAATLAAKKMASSFLLASPSPSAAECEVSLRATLDVLTRL